MIPIENDRLATGSVDTGLAGSHSVKVYNVETGKLVYSFENSENSTDFHNEAVYSLAYFPNGFLASGSGDSTIKVFI